MKRVLIFFLLSPLPAFGLSSDARQFMEISKQLEPVQCEKRKLRRAIALAEVEKNQTEVKTLRDRFTELDRDPKTTTLERRLAELEPRVAKSSDPEDLAAISLQQRQAFYRCE